MTGDRPSEPTGARTRARRSDAVRNAERVFAAALDVSARHGLDVGPSEVAAAAGVGRATVYRSFPSREALISAVVEHKLAILTERLDEVSRHEDAWLGLREMIVALMEYVRTDRLLGDALLRWPDLFPPASRASTRLAALLDRGRRQRVIAEGVTGFDLRLLVGGAGHALRMTGAVDPGSWRHAAELVAAAARGPASRPDPPVPAADSPTTDDLATNDPTTNDPATGGSRP